jgi:hypothetical protein
MSGRDILDNLVEICKGFGGTEKTSLQVVGLRRGSELTIYYPQFALCKPKVLLTVQNNAA